MRRPHAAAGRSLFFCTAVMLRRRTMFHCAAATEHTATRKRYFHA